MGEIQGTLLQHPHLFRFLLFFLHFHYCFLHLRCSIRLEPYYCFRFVMLRDFHVTHCHPDFRVPENLLQNSDIGPGQNGSGGKCVTQIDLTGGFCTSGSERKSTLEGRWYADEKVQAGADRELAAAN